MESWGRARLWGQEAQRPTGEWGHRQTARGPHTDHKKMPGAQQRKSRWRGARDSITNGLVDRVQWLDFIFESLMDL